MGLIMARVAAAFPNSKPDKVTMQIYFELLGDIPADELKTAVDICIGEPGRVFPPTIGEIKSAWLEWRETRPSQYKQIESHEQPVYVPMPQYCIDELDAFFKAKGIKSKWRDVYMHVAQESRK
jgi:hypothetical protein